MLIKHRKGLPFREGRNLIMKKMIKKQAVISTLGLRSALSSLALGACLILGHVLGQALFKIVFDDFVCFEF